MKKLVVVLLALALVLSLAACGSGGNGKSAAAARKPDYYSVSLDGVYDEDGAAFVPMMDGNAVKLKGDISQAQLTPDRSKVVFLSDGTLYMQDSSSEEKTKITSDVEEFIVVDNGLFYVNEDGMVYRYLFETGEFLRIANLEDDLDDVTVSDKSLCMAYAMDGSIYSLAADAEEAEKIGSYDDDITMNWISDDGSSIVWSESTSDTETVYIYENGERVRIGDFDVSSANYYYGCDVYADLSGQYLTIMCSYDNVMYLKKAGEEALKIRLSDTPDSTNAFTPDGRFNSVEFKPEGGLYVVCESSLYWIDDQGEREKVASNINNPFFTNGYVFYTDDDDTLRWGKLEGTELEPEKIASDVSRIVSFAPGTDVVYYLRDVKDNIGTLYAYKVGEEDPVKVTSDVYRYSISTSPDGRTIFYFKDREEIPKGWYDYAGVLYMFAYGDENPTKIASDVYVEYAESGFNKAYTDPSAFTYRKSPYMSDDELLFNLVFFNGTESVTLAKDVSEYYRGE